MKLRQLLQQLQAQQPRKQQPRQLINPQPQLIPEQQHRPAGFVLMAQYLKVAVAVEPLTQVGIVAPMFIKQLYAPTQPQLIPEQPQQLFLQQALHAQ